MAKKPASCTSISAWWWIRARLRCVLTDGWWDRRGENEIDLVCEDESERTLSFFEVKTDARRIDLDALRTKTEAFFAKNPEKRGFDSSFGGLSLSDL